MSSTKRTLSIVPGTSLWQIFAVAPVEATMGIVQKIFYFHVPSAYVMYLGAAVCFGLRLLGAWRHWNLPTAVGV